MFRLLKTYEIRGSQVPWTHHSHDLRWLGEDTLNIVYFSQAHLNYAPIEAVYIVENPLFDTSSIHYLHCGNAPREGPSNYRNRTTRYNEGPAPFIPL